MVAFTRKTMPEVYRLIVPSTFVIDGSGVVRTVFPKAKVDGHVEMVLEAVSAP